MRWTLARQRLARMLLTCALLAWPMVASAQDATVNGTVTDASGAVMPGVAVQVRHEASGNSFDGVTDGRGMYRIQVRPGTCRVTAELQGFKPTARTVELLMGQQATVDLQMALSSLEQSVTVTGEAPLIDTTSSVVSGNIDPRQMEQLPASGRQWTSLALLAPGNRTTAQSENPVQDRQDVRDFQLNMDGQQVTQNTGVGGQPLYSRDSISEFQFISNRYDATQGRSAGVQVLAVTKSGTNTPSGSFGGYFRDSKFNAMEPLLGRVPPMASQQLSGTFGGPIVKDRIHFFANAEYQRSPKTSIWTTRFPDFNVSLQGVDVVKMGGGRVDYQVSSKSRLMLKASGALFTQPFGAGSASNHPAATLKYWRNTRELLGSLTKVINNSTLNELKIGYSEFHYRQSFLATWSKHPQAVIGITNGAPNITWSNFAIRGNPQSPQETAQKLTMFRDDLTLSFDKRGRHDLKIGGEYIRTNIDSYNCRNCMGIYTSTRPAPTNLASLIPDPFNVDTWNLNALSSTITGFSLGIGEYQKYFARHVYAAYLQDDWGIGSRFTLNLGVRYDLIWNAFANDVAIEPFIKAGRPQDANNVQPRLGGVYRVNDRTVLRGGFGLYYGDTQTNTLSYTYSFATLANVGIINDGRPDFFTNPFNGPIPTAAQAFARFCSGPAGNVPGCLRRDILELAATPSAAHLPYSWQGSVGFQRQLSDTAALEMDYVYHNMQNEKMIQSNINLGWNPATGANYPYTDVSKRPYPDWGTVGMDPFNGYAGYHGLQTVFTRRMRNNWQLSANYTLSGLWDAQPIPIDGATMQQVTIPLQKDLGGEYTLAPSDQRHRIVMNGIWQMWRGLQMSGLVFFGSGERLSTSYGGDLRLLGGTITESQGARLRPDGTIVPRNALVGDPVLRVDMRVQQRVKVGRIGLEGMLELFNVFNRTNYGSYITAQSDSRYGQPAYNSNISYAARSAQLGFRITF